MALKCKKMATANVIFQGAAPNAFEGRISSYSLINNGHINVDNFFDDAFAIFENKQENLLSNQTLIKTYATFIVDLVKPIGPTRDAEVRRTFYIKCETRIIDMDTNLFEWFNENVIRLCKTRLDEFASVNSGWILEAIRRLEVCNNYYDPIGASSYIALPEKWAKMNSRNNCIVNVKNRDEMCFKWAILSAICNIDDRKKAEKKCTYMPYSYRLNYSDLNFPVQVNDIKKFEANNPQISINVYVIERGKIAVLRLTPKVRQMHIHLLLLHKLGEHGDYNEINFDSVVPVKSHYCWIRDLGALLREQCTSHNGRIFFCDRCLQFFYSKQRQQEHSVLCVKENICAIKMPAENQNILKFKRIENVLQVPFIIYADIESILLPISSENDEAFCATSETTRAYQKHEACAIGYYFKCAFDDGLSRYNSDMSVNCIEWFCDELLSISKQVQDIFENIKPMNLTAEQSMNYWCADVCHICSEKFVFEFPVDIAVGERKVRDHSHLTGEFRGAAHSKCNLKFQDSRIIPVVFHNLSCYDSHFIIRKLMSTFAGDINIIPNDDQHYIAFTKNVDDTARKCGSGFLNRTLIKFRFIDSYRFLDASLDSLAQALPSANKITLHREFGNINNIDDGKMQLLERKGVFPYDFLDSWNKLKIAALPPKDAFFSHLTESHISDEEYAHAQAVWNAFNIQNLGEYANLYLKTDILLLCDVFEDFRETLYNLFKLDPAHYVTLPGFSFDAMLRFTKVEIELLTDVDMLMFVERALRGGITQCTMRHAKANNQYLDDFDASKEKSFLLYIDANALYADVMQNKPLPLNSFEWVENVENLTFNDIMNMVRDPQVGCFIEADLEYPRHLHDSHRAYPLCAEKMIPPKSREESRGYQYSRTCPSDANREKLMLTLYDKQQYVMHHAMLEFVVSQGLKVKKIHRIMRFKQSAFLSSYIAENTRMRTFHSTSEFEKQLWKKNSNILFGKCCERIKNRRMIKLKQYWGGKKGASGLIASPAFKRVTVFDENLVAIELQQTILHMDKPCFIGSAILELSKLTMAKFHHEFIVPEYGNNKCELLYTDTDSFIYLFTGIDDIYAEIKKHINRFDTSDYASDNAYGIPLVNKKVPGLMKDENNGRPMSEFVGLRAKMYSTRVMGHDALKKAKGVKRYVLKKSITFDDYLRCINDNCILSREQNSIRSKMHQVYSIKQTKISLSPYDDKRLILEDGIHTLPWGHYSI